MCRSALENHRKIHIYLCPNSRTIEEECSGGCESAGLAFLPGFSKHFLMSGICRRPYIRQEEDGVGREEEHDNEQGKKELGRFSNLFALFATLSHVDLHVCR